MTHSLSDSVNRATLQPSRKQFDILPGNSLLESGLSAGIALPFGCANGSCGKCQARICKGDVQKIKHHDFSVGEAQKINGHCLLCSYTANGDVEIEVHEALSVDDVPLQELTAKLCRLEHVGNVSIATFKFSRGKALRFLPGQHALLTLDNGNALSLPIASCPCNAQIAEFHLTDEPASSATLIQLKEKINNRGTKRERLVISGPSGHYTLNPSSNKARIFIAKGGDFAQLQGMLEQVLSTDIGAPCCLLWQATEHTGQYRSNLCRSWHDALDEFTFIPLTENSDPIAALPPPWKKLLLQSEIYLGQHDKQLQATLIQSGVNSDMVFYPRASASDD